MSQTENNQKKTASEDEGAYFGKTELLMAERLKSYRDIAEALLDEACRYTVREAETIVKQFLKGKVK